MPVVNCTPYAKSLNYQGKKPVLVDNGKVVSHGNQEWNLFCERLREQTPQPSFDSLATSQTRTYC